MNATMLTILLVIVVILIICFISPTLTFLGFVLKPVIWIFSGIIKMFKKAFKELSAAKKEQQKKID